MSFYAVYNRLSTLKLCLIFLEQIILVTGCILFAGPPSKRDKNARRFGAEYKAKVCILWMMERTVNIPLERVFKSPFSVPAPGRILLHLGGNYVAHFSDNLSVQPLVCH